MIAENKKEKMNEPIKNIQFSVDELSQNLVKMLDDSDRFTRDKVYQEDPTDFSIYKSTDTEHVEWYYIPVNNKKATWLDEYYNANVKANMISYVVPLYKDGKTIGVVGMNINFDKFKDIVNEKTGIKDNYAFPLNKDNKLELLNILEELKEKSKNIDQSAGKISNNVEETSATSEEISASIQEVDSSINALSDKAIEGSDNANKSRERVVDVKRIKSN